MDLLHKLFYRLKLFFQSWTLNVGLYLESPSLTALSMKAVCVRIKPSPLLGVLCLGRTIFIDDVNAMAHHSGKIRYEVIHRRYWKKILYHFLSSEEAGKLEESNYHLPNFCEAGKKKYFDFLVRLVPTLKKQLNFSAVLSGNFGYLEQQEIAAACQKLGIPFLVLHKEGLAITSTLDSFAVICKDYRFIGDKLLVYSEAIKHALLASGLRGITEEKITVVGMPRMDRYSQPYSPPSQKQIVFFSFYPSDKFFFLINEQMVDDKAKLQEAARRVDDFHIWVMNAAAKHPEIKVIIKTKSSQHYLDYVLDIYHKNFSQPLSNLQIVNYGEVPDLIRASSIVMGFSSTTLIEAVAASKTIVAPFFNDLIAAKHWDYFENYPYLINYVKTEEELEKMILKPLLGNPKNEALRKKFLEGLIFTPDGKASQRAEQAILNTITSGARVHK